jgi:Rieske Fe-S protein
MMPEEPETTMPPDIDAQPPVDPDRREFMAKAISIVAGGAIVSVPVGVGVATLTAPIFSKGQGGIKIRLAAVDDLPGDGSPKLYQVVAERTDAWTKYPAKPLGSIFLRLREDGGVEAFNSSCPHAGCSVGFRSKDEGYFCPCHESVFLLDGSRGKSCVSPRGLDSLEVDKDRLKNGEIWVTFQNFVAGIGDKKAI